MDGAAWLRALHIMAFTAWMAGMWYLPRLMVYHTGVAVGSEASETFKTMERRLLKAIATPAMAVTLLVGVALASVQGQWQDGWLHAKLVLVLLMLACHGILARHVRRFQADERPRPATWYRAFNEAPTLLFVGIVLLVILKPL
jgi:protoporphyrinogen IX oxidase